jgi:hypothetical protein
LKRAYRVKKIKRKVFCSTENISHPTSSVL